MIQRVLTICMVHVLLVAAIAESATEGIYGKDNRKAYTAMPDSVYNRELASAVCMITTSANLEPTSNGKYKLYFYGKLHSWLRSQYGKSGERVCDDVRFRDQYIVGSAGTGALVDDDKVITAKHITEQMRKQGGGLNKIVCVFRRFGINSGDVLNKTISLTGGLAKTMPAASIPYVIVDSSEVRFVTAELAAGDSADMFNDWSLLRLAKPAPKSLKRLCFYKGSDVENRISTDQIYTIGHPKGLPLVMADSAFLQNRSAVGMEADLDVYKGNSGSPVFVKINSVNKSTFEYRIVGILTRGNGDYAYKNGISGGTQQWCICDSVRSTPEPYGYQKIAPAYKINTSFIAVDPCSKQIEQPPRPQGSKVSSCKTVSVAVRLQGDEPKGTYALRWDALNASTIVITSASQIVNASFCYSPGTHYVIYLELIGLGGGLGKAAVYRRKLAEGYIPYETTGSEGTSDGIEVKFTHKKVSPDGTFPTIQAAIAASSSGDTIYVPAGSYYEKLNISNKANLFIYGDGMYETGLRWLGSEPVIDIVSSTSIKIVGMYISHTASPLDIGSVVGDGLARKILPQQYGIRVTNSASCDIVDNLVETGDNGVYLSDAQNCVIAQNVIHSTTHTSGIILNNSSGCAVAGNLLETSRGDALVLAGANSVANIIALNTFNNVLLNAIRIKSGVCGNTILDNNVYQDVLGKDILQEDGSVCNVAPSPTIFYQPFEYHQQEGGIYEPEKWGFGPVSYWGVPRDDDGSSEYPYASAYLLSNSPGGWTALSAALSPSFSAQAERDQHSIVVKWRIALPTEHGPSWRENNKFWLSLCDHSGRKMYTVLFKPNRAQDQYTSSDLQLTKDEDVARSLLQEAWTHTLTPHGTPPNWLNFVWQLKENGDILLLYDNGSGNMVEYMRVNDKTYKRFDRLHLNYKTGDGDSNYKILVDEVTVINE